MEPAVFEKLPDYCVGVVVACGLDNHSQSEAVGRMLEQDFGCRVVTGYVDRENNSFDFE